MFVGVQRPRDRARANVVLRFALIMRVEKNIPGIHHEKKLLGRNSRAVLFHHVLQQPAAQV